MASRTFVLSGCLLASITLGWQPAWAIKKAELVQAQTEIPDAHLLDVGIRVFDPGLPENPEDLREIREKGVFEDVRRSEARYIPFLLMQTLRSSGFWGAVRVVPDMHIVDVVISGTIQSSTGTELKLKVRVVDARGEVWLKKGYKEKADHTVYDGEGDLPDPYQNLYNRIANDVLKARQKLDDEDVRRLRSVSRLRFAADLAPDAFGDYLSLDKKGRYRLEKLPANDDPMMARITSIRQRDEMFIDALDQYYVGFCANMREPYGEWRARSFEREQMAKKMVQQGVLETILGVGLIAGGFAAAATVTDDDAGHRVFKGGLLAGIEVIKGGVAKTHEARTQREVLRELGQSLDSDIAPRLMKVDSDVTRLTGSVENQYAVWREHLRRIFAFETGLPLDPN